MKVFLVENSPPVRDRLRALLQGVKGVEMVGEATSAVEALRGIAASGAEVVVLDLHLDGDGTGFDVLRGLRQSSPPVAAYILSNFASETYRRAAQRLGARGFFDKTSDIPLLLAAISENS
jgi:DNA-binding NarL/FixJ family response regulator